MEGARDSRRSAIVGGTVDYADPEVFMLIMQFNNNTQSGCTATLIARRTLLTAAHCVDPRIGNATSVQIWAMNKTDVNTAGYGDLIRVVETRMHPNWNPNNGLSSDIAMALLESAPNVAKVKPWNTSSIGSFGGKPVRAVGYGTTGKAGNGSGTKREVNLTFRQLTSSLFYLGDGMGKGVCHGDSGGPSFHTFSDGVERQVGIHSFTNNEDCFDGADTRVDTYASFINQWLTDKEGPQCAADGQCKTGCSPVDTDCYCLADGNCNAQCPVLTQDPDCPKDCVKNGVCSTQPCPTADLDCVPDGAKCASEVQCQGRQCVSDAQRPDWYCSRTCSAGGSCPTGMTCPAGGGICRYPTLPSADPGQACTFNQTYCAGGPFACSGPVGAATTCVRTCSAAGDCPEGQPCEAGQNNIKFCRAPVKAPIYLKAAWTEGEVASSCSQAAGAPGSLALGLLLMLGLRRRRG